MAGITINQELLESAKLKAVETDANMLDKLSTGHQVIGVGAISQDSLAISKNSERVSGLYDYLDDSRTKVDSKLQSGLRTNQAEIQMVGYHEIEENISQIEDPIVGIQQGETLESSLQMDETFIKKITCINLGNCDDKTNPICRNRGGCDDGGNGICSNRTECDDDDDDGDNGRNGICGNRKGECDGAENGICWNRKCRHEAELINVSIGELTQMRDRIDNVKTGLEQLIQNNPVDDSDTYSRTGGLNTYNANTASLSRPTETTSSVDNAANELNIAENHLIQQTRDAGVTGASALTIASGEVTQFLRLLR
jgi:hypothetical protein